MVEVEGVVEEQAALKGGAAVGQQGAGVVERGVGAAVAFQGEGGEGAVAQLPIKGITHYTLTITH